MKYHVVTLIQKSGSSTQLIGARKSIIITGETNLDLDHMKVKPFWEIANKVNVSSNSIKVSLAKLLLTRTRENNKKTIPVRPEPHDNKVSVVESITHDYVVMLKYVRT